MIKDKREAGRLWCGVVGREKDQGAVLKWNGEWPMFKASSQ
jgi:hypothetical protein